MPETAMDEDGLVMARKYNIWSPRQVASMQTVSIAHSVDEPSHFHLWCGVPTTNGLHIPTPLLCGQDIHEMPS